MTESEFWVHLEFRLGEEFAGLPERHYRYFWCDGFFPSQYLGNGSISRIIGTA